MYNLNEEEELTHYGQSLAEMEKFNDMVNSDDESEEKGLLSGGYHLCPNRHKLMWYLEPVLVVSDVCK